MRTRSPVSLRACAFIAMLCNCGPNQVTARKLEDAVGPTFANLIQTQESVLGLPPLDVVTFQTSARCHRIGPGTEIRGGGNWLCTLEWFPPGHRGPWHDTYDVSVTMDGCYTATADGVEGHVGGPKLVTRDGTKITNLLYVFEGCFDTTT
jgi:hypothetical protein